MQSETLFEMRDIFTYFLFYCIEFFGGVVLLWHKNYYICCKPSLRPKTMNYEHNYLSRNNFAMTAAV